MINSNICKRIQVMVKNGRCYIGNHEVRYSDTKALVDGSRYLYLKYSILSDGYYLTSRA